MNKCLTKANVLIKILASSPPPPDPQQRQQQDELGRGRPARQGGLPGGGDRQGAARHGGLHRQHPLRLREMGGSHSGRGQGQERRLRAGQALLHLRGELWDICEAVAGKNVHDSRSFSEAVSILSLLSCLIFVYCAELGFFLVIFN